MKPKHLLMPVVAAITLSVLSMVVGADMVSTHQALGQTAANQDRARVRAILDRNEAREQLQAIDIDIDLVKERLAGLTDQEVHELAQKLDTLPAGGEISDRHLIAILLIVLLVVLLI